MQPEEIQQLAAELAQFVIDAGRVDKDPDWFLSSLGAEVAFEADERGYANADQIAEAAVQLYTK